MEADQNFIIVHFSVWYGSNLQCSITGTRSTIIMNFEIKHQRGFGTFENFAHHEPSKLLMFTKVILSRSV